MVDLKQKVMLFLLQEEIIKKKVQLSFKPSSYPLFSFPLIGIETTVEVHEDQEHHNKSFQNGRCKDTTPSRQMTSQTFFKHSNGIFFLSHHRKSQEYTLSLEYMNQQVCLLQLQCKVAQSFIFPSVVPTRPLLISIDLIIASPQNDIYYFEMAMFTVPGLRILGTFSCEQIMDRATQISYRFVRTMIKIKERAKQLKHFEVFKQKDVLLGET